MSRGDSRHVRWQRIVALRAFQSATHAVAPEPVEPIEPATDPAWSSTRLDELRGNVSHELGEIERASMAACRFVALAEASYRQAREARARLLGLDRIVDAITAPPEDRAIIYRVYVDGCHVDTVEYRADRSRSYVLEALTAAGYPGAHIEEVHEPDGEREGQDADASEHRAGLHGQ